MKTADTVHCTEVYGRPPLPYDAVASRTRFAVDPRLVGQLRMTTGAGGFSGAKILMVVLGVRLFKRQLGV